MPILVLARHCEAGPAATDIDRPLTDHGRGQADRAAEFLAGYDLDMIVRSEARRTVETSEPVVEAQKKRRSAAEESGTAPDLEVTTDATLYMAGVEDWLEVLSTIPPEARGAYVVGHQPTVGAVIDEVCAKARMAGSSSPFGEFLGPIHPSTLAVFDLPDWEVPVGDFPLPEIHSF
ncbi:SixA phosphatase family protein [Brevibacterium litoralis]|uniref:SixA phosphatase family protein n=1 Tax=Brevibacterium litoralis TaxID=3138935 RepID=UPI0032EBB063